MGGDELVKVFEDGELFVEQTFKDVQARARITKPALVSAMRGAVDNLNLKTEFFQKMSSDEAIACRLAEAACGSKWKQAHATHLEAVKAACPKYSAALDKIGVTAAM